MQNNKEKKKSSTQRSSNFLKNNEAFGTKQTKKLDN